MPQHYVYAAHAESPIVVCDNAWLLAGEVGEAGYDVGINFRGTEGLVTQLHSRDIYRGQVNRLMIVAHGARGAFWIDHEPSDNNLNDEDVANVPGLGTSNFYSLAFGWTFRNLNTPAILRQVHLVGHFLHSRSEVVLLGCNAGAGSPGNQFLITLSLLWPGVRVVAFPVIMANLGGQSVRSGEHCYPPGIQATAATGASGPRRFDEPEPEGYRLSSAVTQGRVWGNSSHNLAKIAQNGIIVRAPGLL